MEYLTINDENRLRQENEVLKVKKSEIEQLKEQAKEYKQSLYYIDYLKDTIEEYQKSESEKASQIEFIYSQMKRFGEKIDLIEKKTLERLGLKE